jgi:hypothetical protein
VEKPFIYNPCQINQQQHTDEGVEPFPADIGQDFGMLLYQDLQQGKAGENADIVKHFFEDAFGIGVVKVEENTHKGQNQIFKAEAGMIGPPK